MLKILVKLDKTKMTYHEIKHWYIYLFSKLKSVNIFVCTMKSNVALLSAQNCKHICVSKAFSLICRCETPSTNKNVLKYFFSMNSQNPNFHGQSELITLVSILVLVFFLQKDFIDWKNSWNLAFRIHEAMCWAAAKC